MTNVIKRLDIAARRAAVAKMIARGFDASGVANKLTKLGYRTAQGKSITPGLVGKDLKVVEDEWMRKATADITRHKARQFHELQKMKQQAWGKNNLELVLKILEKEMGLLGTKMTAVEKEQPKYVKNETNNQQFNILTIDERDKRISEILETARTRKTELVAASGPSVESTAETTESV